MVKDFSDNHVGIRSRAVIKDGGNLPHRRIAGDIGTEGVDFYRIRGIEHRGKAAEIFRLLYQYKRGLLRRNGYRSIFGNMQAITGIVPSSRTHGDFGFVLPSKMHGTLKEPQSLAPSPVKKAFAPP